ncbi:hypothetical protein [Candidatus Leptofilum sp.]|uniref:hypothetical protein n=1 Tax=Candidatus Leptofilum sp. TaxID=3241576 RepID=UPI003B5CA1EB
MKKTFILIFFLLIGIGAAACGGDGGGNTPPSDPAELKSFHLAGVCTGTVIEAAADYDASGSGPHKIALYSQNSFDGDIYDIMFPSQTDIPEAWTTAVDQPFSDIELVGCLARTETTLVDTCEGYEIDEEEREGTVEIYDAMYELTIYAAKTGEVVGTATIETFMDECPSFVMFSTGSGEDLVEERYGNPDDALVGLVESYVNP